MILISHEIYILYLNYYIIFLFRL